MHVAYVILSALSLLNLGVEGATITKALTSKHSSDFHQARKVIHDRQFHNADFGSGSAMSKDEKASVAQSTKHTSRDSPAYDAVADELDTTVTDKNGSGVKANLNKKFADILLPSASARSDDLSTTEDEDIQAPDVGGGIPGQVVSDSLSGQDSPLPATFDPLLSETTPMLSEALPSLSGLSSGGLIRRQDVDDDEVGEVAKEVKSMSTSLAGVSSSEGNYVVPQKLERRFSKESREDGSLETDVGGSPVVLQPVPDVLSKLFSSRAVKADLPVTIPRQLDPKSSISSKRQVDLTEIDVKALGNAQSEDVKLG